MFYDCFNFGYVFIGEVCYDIKCVYVLPVRLGGLGLINPSSAAHSGFCYSERLTAPLIALIVAQCATQTVDHDHIHQLKQSIRKNNREHQTMVADTLQSDLPHLLNAVSTLPRNLGHLPGLLFCQYWSMAFTYTRVIFGMLYLYVMVLHHLIHQILASVEPLSRLTMLWYVLLGDFLRSDIMRFEV